MKPVPFSLAIDDGSPINTFYFHDLGHRHEFFVPDSFNRRFLASVREYGFRGKLSVVPMPLGLGRLDRTVLHLPPKEQCKFLNSIAELKDAFSITPELLTHFSAYDPAIDRLHHVYEDVWIDSHNASEISDYTAIALEILDNVGLTPTGVSAPWFAGVANETEFLRGVGMAFKKQLHQERCFCRMGSKDGITVPVLKVDDAECGKVMRIPAHILDPLWGTQLPVSKREAQAEMKRQLDAMLTKNGASGSLIGMVEKGEPVVFLTHWQSLFSDGRLVGLEALEELARRMRKNFGSRVEWVTMEDLAWKKGF